MIVRFKLKSGGKINLVASNVSHFDESNSGTKITMNNGFAFDVEESAQSVRGAFKRLAAPASTDAE